MLLYKDDANDDNKALSTIEFSLVCISPISFPPLLACSLAHIIRQTAETLLLISCLEITNENKTTKQNRELPNN